MEDVIDRLDERDDVQKTEYTRYDVDEGRMTIELWHNAEGLQAVFKKAMDGVVSPRGLQEYAKEQALASRETRIDMKTELQALYPKTTDELDVDEDGDVTWHDYEVTGHFGEVCTISAPSKEKAMEWAAVNRPEKAERVDE